MNGEEAAASLFGSEDSGSDLFATLGTETTSPQPSTNDLFSSAASSHAQQNDTYDFLSDTQSYPAYQSEFLEYPKTQTHTAPTAITQNESTEQRPWDEGESDGAGLAYPLSPNAQPIEPVSPTTIAYNNYASSANSIGYTGRSSYGAYDPPVPAKPMSSTQSPYDAYNSTVPTTSYADHRAYDHAVPVSATTQSTYNTHVLAPSTVTESTYGTHDSHVATNTRSNYGAYDPPAPANRTDYRLYEPAIPNTSISQSNYQPSEPYSHSVMHSNYGTYNPPAPTTLTTRSYDSSTASYHDTEPVRTGSPQISVNATPPVLPVTKSTVTRPKVSNAYDPPFPTTLPTRRGSRPGTVTAQQAYAQYQKPAAINYAQTAEASSADLDNHHSQSAIARESHDPPANGYTWNTISHQQNSEERPRVPDSTSYTDLYDYNGANFVHDDVSPTIDSPKEAHYVDQSLAGNDHEATSLQDIVEESVNTGNVIEEVFPPLSIESLPNGPQALLDPGQPNVASPASIPLPYSPPIKDVHEHEWTPLARGGSIGKAASYHSPYIPQSAPKKDATISNDIVDPYAPKNTHHANNYVPRTSSPLSTSGGRPSDAKNHMNTAVKPNRINSPPHGAISKPLGGITVPTNLYNLPMNSSLDGQNRQVSQLSEARLGPQELLIKHAVAQYAPSPSLIGANDPLSRTSARAPLVTFGFGGRMITCFHGMPGLNAGFDVAFSSRTTSELKIRTLHKLLPESTLTATESSYPGPLLADPGTTSISLVRSNLVTQTKTKKTSVLNYLAGRISEFHQGLGYLSGSEGRRAENKLVLVKLLSVMVENDGRLLGTPQAEAAVRSTLVPRLECAPMTQDAVSLQASYKLPVSNEAPISVTSLRPSALDKIEELLLQGDRRGAYQFAMEEKLWAHAMVIASSIDKESWKDVVHDFLRTELAVRAEPDNSILGPNGHLSTSHSHKNSRESLRVAYSLFSGQGPTAIQELAPVSLLQRGLGGHFQPSTMSAITPRTPNFTPMQPNLPSIPAESLTKWAETVAMMISSPLTPETSSALTALGDQLLATDWVEAAHVCYILSPQTSLVGGLGSPSARVTLVGSKNPADVMKDSDALIYSEILEFALSLVPVAKGQEPFHGIPHLQAYRFIKAVQFAEIGQIQLANRYCEAVNTSLSHTSPYTNLALLEQLQGLQQRLSGVFPGDKSGSWIGGKLTKPSLDSIGGWLEGRFTKLVTGESESAPLASDPLKSIDQPFVGPFAHYSTISSNTPSARSSPQPQPQPQSTTVNAPPQRTSSAMATTSPYSQQTQVERSSSAMGYVRQRPSVQTQGSSNSLSSSQSSPVGFGLNNISHGSDPYASKAESSSPNDETETPIQGSWWGSSNDANGASNTPTAATFMKVDGSSIQASNEGFISLMDNHSFSVGSTKHVSPAPPAMNDDDDDDLGLGNSKPKPKVEQEGTSPTKEDTKSTPPKVTAAAAEPAKTETPASSGGSWLGRWFKRSDSTTPGPIKASLGEESAFYYDKEQKRWVNRKVGDDTTAKPATPPPPPSRAQTASPGMTGSKPQPPASAPPARSASAVDLSEPPVKAPMRIRSNLAPPMESAPSTPTGTRLNPSGPPPPIRPKSQATKRNVRSRYVDVFQQEGGGAA